MFFLLIIIIINLDHARDIIMVTIMVCIINPFCHY